MDGFTACPASGEDTAPSTTQRLTWASDGIYQKTADKTTALTDSRALARFC
ncbi:hypothetical protein CFBP2533_42620 [Xanthomonas hortorum pv. pelargonii]|uniref:Uncharacterized protein n=1 Tax=Xanthomonas hortorum pv. pelargonii TaxID=453602 RepID=A0A6V7F491_9XANT|nr:hypothetical protein CFBP2533_42620 [Xanthomonas hortorum pv. pelargonii]CAD0358333.1 hypothetical protein CFBP2533_42620 [Xanthomonas hortorum pv. pelargonii]